MVRNSIRASGSLWRQVAHLVKGLEAQVSTGAQRFRVSGKAASLLGDWTEITPDMLHEDVDFRFLGLTDLHTFGNRLQGMAQWMNRWGPMLQTMPQVNINALCRMDFELSVGRSSINDIFPEQSAPWEAWTQEEENVALMAGQEVSVHKDDDDADHMRKMKPMMEQLARDNAPSYILDKVMKHFMAHTAQAQQKAVEQKAQQQKAQQNARLMEPQGGKPGVDRPPTEGGMQAQEKGVTPGPPQARTVARTGREGSGESQTQRMTG